MTVDYLSEGVLTEGEAWVFIASTELSTAAATVTFASGTGKQNWSQYLDLYLIAAPRRDSSSAGVGNYRLNNDAGSTSYVRQEFYTNGATAYAYGTTGYSYNRFGSMPGGASNYFGGSVTQFFDINSGKYKSSITQYSNEYSTGGSGGIVAGTWLSQAAVTEIDLTLNSGTNFAVGSRFDLYGILPKMVS